MTEKREFCYTVTWHCIEPKCYFAGYDLETAQQLAIKLRKRHSTFAITIQKEIL
jgi:hypothetical protein